MTSVRVGETEAIPHTPYILIGPVKNVTMHTMGIIVIRYQLLVFEKDREPAYITIYFLALASELAKVIDKLAKGSETKQKQCF